MKRLAGAGSFCDLAALIAVGVPPVQANASNIGRRLWFPRDRGQPRWAYRDGLDLLAAVKLRPLLLTTLAGLWGRRGAAAVLTPSEDANT